MIEKSSLFSQVGEERHECLQTFLVPVVCSLVFHYTKGSSGGVVVKLLACRASGRGSISGLATTVSEIGYLLLPSCDMAEILLKWHKSSKQPPSQPIHYAEKPKRKLQNHTICFTQCDNIDS